MNLTDEPRVSSGNADRLMIVSPPTYEGAPERALSVGMVGTVVSTWYGARQPIVRCFWENGIERTVDMACVEREGADDGRPS